MELTAFHVVTGKRANSWRFRRVSSRLSLAISLCLAFGLPSAVGLDVEDRCEELTIPMCKGLHLYERTTFPNLLGHESQSDAALELHQFYPLVKVNCSHHLASFLCILYAPPCFSSIGSVAPPCSSLCDAARYGCVELMNRFGFEWPDALNCSNFPEPGACISEAVLPLTSPSPVESDVETTTRAPQEDRCEELDIPMCNGLHLYERTIFPNLLGHQTQYDAALELFQFYPLVKVNCSHHLASFLCFAYAPPCISHFDGPVPPCRSLCNAVRDRCVQLMNRYGFEWPEALECSNFPQSDLCLSNNHTQDEAPPPTTPVSPPEYGETVTSTTEAVLRPTTPVQRGRCQAVTVPLCRGLWYTETFTPNLLGHETQEQAARTMDQFERFISINCSPHLRYFLCTALVPPCSAALLTPLPPCRSLCVESQRGCGTFFALFRLKWPDVFECSQFPAYGLCVGKEAFLELQIKAARDNEDRIVKCETNIFNILARREEEP